MKNVAISAATAFLCMAMLVFACKKSSNNPDIPDEEDPDWPTDSIRVVVNAGISRPWEILWGPDNHIWMTERTGKISRVDPKTGEIKPLLTIPDVVANGEGGLLGMVLNPEFVVSPDVYVVYNYDTEGGDYREKVVRYKYSNGTLGSPVTIIDNIDASSIHNGSRLLISPDKFLYITTGDASNGANAQLTTSVNGKVLRLNLDGSIPEDNPYPGNPVWSVGHRNQQGLVLVNGIMYASEHGATIEDEVNIIEKDQNYGWPTVQGPCNDAEEVFCAANNVKEPIWSTGSSTFALCGMDYYNYDRIPAWKNTLLVASLKNQTLYKLQLSGDGKMVTGSQAYFSNKYGRLRDVCISPTGRVYICTDEANGKIIEINKEPK